MQVKHSVFPSEIKYFFNGKFLEKTAFYLLCFVVAVSPVVSLFAGLAVATLFAIAGVFPLILFFKDSRYGYLYPTNLCKIVIIFFLYCLLSTLWAIVPSETLSLLFRMIMMFIVAISLVYFIRKINQEDKVMLSNILLYSFIFALVVANFEIFSDGMLTRFFHSFKNNPNYKYNLTDLNRGSTFLAILFWPAFAYLMRKKNKIPALTLFVFTLTTIMRLESQSSAMGLLLGFPAFILILFTKEKGINFAMVFAVISIVFVAVTAKLMDPAKMFQVIPHVPNSASEYRLYIWDYAAEKAYQKPFFGWGFNAARSFPVKDSEFVLGGRHPLPLHPHNNVLQVWLELGIVGLFVFAAFLLAFMQRIKELYRAGDGSRCLTNPEQNMANAEKKICLIGKTCAYLKTFDNNTRRALAMGLFTTYFAMGETAFGMWQNWWVAGGLLSMVLLTAVQE